MPALPIRIGQGFDVHAFAEGRALILGGVTIPHTKGLAGHSDADVLTHAICDAILGALALGDIGRLFPDTDQQYKGIDSLILLDQVVAMARLERFAVCQLDATIIAQAPRLAPHIAAMAERLGQRLSPDCLINIKATTTERLGFTGRGEGIAALACVTLGRDE